MDWVSLLGQVAGIFGGGTGGGGGGMFSTNLDSRAATGPIQFGNFKSTVAEAGATMGSNMVAYALIGAAALVVVVMLKKGK